MSAMALSMFRIGIDIFLFVSLTCASDVFDRVLSDVKPCNEICESTYPQNASVVNSQHESCNRGCRFYSIMEFIHEHHDENATQCDCSSCCREAYNGSEDYNACVLGCQSQKPYYVNEGEDDGPAIHLLYPVMYVHSMYSSILDKAYHHMHVSWSLYMQTDNNQLVVVRSQPQVYANVMDDEDAEDYRALFGDDKTSAYIETNIEPVDSGATPMLKHSQIRAARSFEDSLGLSVDSDMTNSDWLSCIAKRSGIPRLLLCMIILLCAMVMIWLCLTAAVTAPEQRIRAPQKLSINGDLEYLREIGDSKQFQFLLPQDRVEAQPLPIKIKVERI